MDLLQDLENERTDTLVIDENDTEKNDVWSMKEPMVKNDDKTNGNSSTRIGVIIKPNMSCEELTSLTEENQGWYDKEIENRVVDANFERETNLENKEDNDDNKIDGNDGQLEGSNENRQCDPCLLDEVKENAYSFCVVCVEYLCKACARDHRRSKATRNHKVLIDTEMPEDPKMFKMMKSLVSCPEHPEMEVVFKCKTHKKFICTKCLVVSHRKCDEVVEIPNQTTHEQSNISTDPNTFLLNKLQKVHEMTVSVQHKKEENIRQLQSDSSCILKERTNYIKSLQEQLMKLGDISRRETDLILTKTLNELAEDVDSCKIIEMEEMQEKCLLVVALNYGNSTEISMVCEKIEKSIVGFKDATTKQEMKPMVRLRFDPDHNFEDISSIGSVSIVDGKKEEAYQENSARIETVLEFSSDELRDKTLNVGKDIRRKPLIQNSIGKRRIMYDIQSTVSVPSEKCSVSSILILSDGRFVLTDYSNKRVKLLNSDFTVRMEEDLDGNPIDVCQFSRTDLAIITDGAKCINKYFIGCHEILCNGVFPCKLYPISIVSIPNNESEVVILFSNEDRKTLRCSDSGQIEIQIRRFNDGKILKTFNDFKLKSSLKMILENPGRIRMMPKTRNTFLISEYAKLQWLEPDRDKTNILKRKRYFKSNKENAIAEITDITTDKEGNIYVCSKGTKSIHQISIINYMNSIVLFTVTGTPSSLCVDDDNRQLIVGCEGEDFIYVIKLE